MFLAEQRCQVFKTGPLKKWGPVLTGYAFDLIMGPRIETAVVWGFSRLVVLLNRLSLIPLMPYFDEPVEEATECVFSSVCETTVSVSFSVSISLHCFPRGSLLSTLSIASCLCVSLSKSPLVSATNTNALSSHPCFLFVSRWVFDRVWPIEEAERMHPRTEHGEEVEKVKAE